MTIATLLRKLGRTITPGDVMSAGRAPVRMPLLCRVGLHPWRLVTHRGEPDEKFVLLHCARCKHGHLVPGAA